MHSASVSTVNTAGAASTDSQEPPLFQHMREQQIQLEELLAVVFELTTHVRALHATAAAAPAVAPPLPALTPYHRVPGHPAAMLKRYGADPAGYRNFLLAFELYLQEFRDLTPQQCISMVIQRLTGRALD